MQEEFKILAAAESGNLALFESLITPTTNFNFVDTNGLSALMHAAANDHVTITSNLIQAGAQLDLQDKYGRSALMFAASRP